jgi:Ni/Co efflux regulator RcnB
MRKFILMTAAALLVGLPLATAVKAEETTVIKRDRPAVDRTTVIKRDVDRPVVAPPLVEKKVIIHRDRD